MTSSAGPPGTQQDELFGDPREDPEFENSIRPGRLAVFYLTTPDYIDLPPSTTFTEVIDVDIPQLASHEVRLTPEHDPYPPEAQTEGKQFVSLRFWPTDRVAPSEISVLDAPQRVFEATLPREATKRGFLRRFRGRLLDLRDRLSPAREPATVVEAVTAFTESEDPVSDAFERCLLALKDVMRSFRVAIRQPVRMPTRERLPFLVPYFTRNATMPFEWQGPYMFLLHYNLPRAFAREDLPENLMERLFHVFDSLKHGNPMVATTEHWLEGKMVLNRDGDYALAVLRSHMALEALFDNLLTLFFWEEGSKPEATAAEFELSLWKRVSRNFPTRLGGNWSPRGDAPIGRWRENLAPLRNRVVHAGYVPTLAEGKESGEILSEVASFAFGRLARDQAHPKSILLSIGLEGVERHVGSVTESLRQLAASDDGEWLTSYSEWRREFEAALAQDEEARSE